MERSNGGRKTAISRCTPVKNCGDADVRRVAGRSSGCKSWKGEQVRGGDGATWARSDGRRMPALSRCPGIKECGQAGARHVAVELRALAKWKERACLADSWISAT